MSTRLNRASSIVAISMIAMTACGPAVTTSITVSTTTTTTRTTLAPSTTTTTQPTTTTTAEPVTTTTFGTTVEIGDWEGELVEYGPRLGDELLVVGVRYNDVLNVREGPGPDFPSVAMLNPNAQGFEALGLTWLNPDSAWYAVDVGDALGWSSAAFVSQTGGVVVYSPEELDWTDGEVQTSGSLIDLGYLAAGTFTSEEPPSRIEQPSNVIIGSVGEIVLDVLDIGDDSVAGFRLRIVANDVNGTWELDRVEATILCSRGVFERRCV